MIVRVQPKWTFDQVRRAAEALSRYRAEDAAGQFKVVEGEERHGVFLDYNQNAKDRTTCSAYSVRPLPDARLDSLFLEGSPGLRTRRFHSVDGSRAL